MDIRSITENRKNTLRNAIKAKTKQLKAFNGISEAKGDSLIIYFHKSSYFREDDIREALGDTLKKAICVFSDGKIIAIKKRTP